MKRGGADVCGRTDPIDKTDSVQDAEPVLHRALGAGSNAHELTRSEHLVLAEECQKMSVGWRKSTGRRGRDLEPSTVWPATWRATGPRVTLGFAP